MKSFRLYSILLLFSLLSVNAFPAKFYSINAKFGISMRGANSICKDNNGFIWASSKNGILRITNDHYRIYQLPYETANVINVKLIYANSKLIAYTQNGQIFCYNPVFDRFDLVLSLGKELNNKQLSLYSLLFDANGAYWIRLSSGLYKYQSGKLSSIEETLPVGCSMEWFDNQQIIIVSTQKIWLIDIQSLKRKIIYENKSSLRLLISSIFVDRIQNKLWIGTISNGLYCFDLDSKKFVNILKLTIPRQPILTIEKNTDSTFLIGVDGQGIWELNKQGDKVLNVYKESSDDPNSLCGNGVYDIFCDNDKRIWICTVSGGVSYFDQAPSLVTQIIHRTNDANSLINNDVNSILEDVYGKIWFATNNGISYWEVSTNQWKSFYSDKLEQAQVFLTLCEDDQGRIWAGTYSSGVYLLDAKTGKELAHYSRDEIGSPLVSKFIFNIFKDSQGDIWIGGVSDEFICYLSKENKFRTYSNVSISSFDEISANQILLGCSYGLSLLNKQTGLINKLVVGFVVQDILLIGDDVWICTSGDGLLKYNLKDKTTKKFTTQSGIPSNFVNSIIYDGSYLWLGTESGLCRFNLNDNTVLTFSSIYALSGISFNSHSCFILKNGQLAWGTNNGAVFFTPNLIDKIPAKGKIFFQDLTISGRSVMEISTFNLNTPIDNLKDINLKYSQNNLSLEMLSIGDESGSKFSWKLEGFDKTWTVPTENRILTYTNIPSGKYVLKIKLYNSSLSDVLSERFITIKVTPPFWGAVWFWIVISLVISGIIFLYFLYYINLLKQRHSVEKIRFFTNTAHDIRNSLTLIKAPVEELKKETKLTEPGQYFLSLAIEQARRLSSVVTQLLDFQKVDIGKEQLSLSMTDIVKMVSNRRLMFDSYSKSKNIELTFSSEHDNYITAIDESKIEKVIDNLISNAIKYSNSGNQVNIELKGDNKNWILQVKDQGIGISKKAQRQLFKEFHRGDNAINSKIIGSGIGLLLVKNYVLMHNGRISCDSQENLGSTFRVAIPYKKISTGLKPGNTISSQQSFSLIPFSNKVQVPTEQHINLTKEITVLIVEDNDDLLDFMYNALNDEFNIYTAENGLKAWEFISTQMPDLIVSDVMMPGKDGFELCKLIKSTYETSHIPVILLTGLSEKTEQLHGLGLGADDYLTKPFDMDLLIKRINTIIRNRETIRDKALKLIKGNDKEPLLANELNDKFVKKMLEVAKSNIANSEFNKDVFASAMNVSPSLLYKKIKSLTNQTPTDFIKIVRLNYAMELLQTRKYNITEVSELCGFNSVGYFSTVFKKHFGKPPVKILE